MVSVCQEDRLPSCGCSVNPQLGSLSSWQTAELWVLRKPKSALSRLAKVWKITIILEFFKNKYLKCVLSPMYFIFLFVFTSISKRQAVLVVLTMISTPDKAPTSSLESACHAGHICSVWYPIPFYCIVQIKSD